jgi:hypothetical protein
MSNGKGIEMTEELMIPGGCGDLATPAVVGGRVAIWHETYADQADPIPGTIVAVTSKRVRVEFDDRLGDPRLVDPRHLTRWSEPREACDCDDADGVVYGDCPVHGWIEA